MTHHPLQPVLSHYGLRTDQVQIEPLSNAGGWSGSLLWRVTDATNQPFCLRRWPTEHPTIDRLRLIHCVLLQVARGLPIIPSPRRTSTGETFICHDDHLWELTNWLPGTADFHVNPSTIRLRAAMHALATFHKLASRFQTRTGPAPAITDRLAQLQSLDCVALRRIEQSLIAPLHNELDIPAARLLAALKQRLQRQLPYCPLSATSQLSLQPAIRDIHHDHVLFIGDVVTGLIDFGALRIDTPLTDIARLLGSLVTDDMSARQVALDAYSELRPLFDSDRNLIDWLDQTGIILSAHNWLRWLYLDRRDMGPTTRIAHRLNELTGRLEYQSG